MKLATERAEKLPLAILAKAFRGELVPTQDELARGAEVTSITVRLFSCSS